MNIGRLIRILAFLTLPVALVAQPQAPAGAPPETEQTQVPGGAAALRDVAADNGARTFPSSSDASQNRRSSRKARDCTKATARRATASISAAVSRAARTSCDSQTLLSDKSGELIAPIVTGGRPNPAAGAPPMPAFPFLPDDLKAIAEYLHSVLAQAARKVGRRSAKWFRRRRCSLATRPPARLSSPRSAAPATRSTGDLRGIASRARRSARAAEPVDHRAGGGGRGGARRRRARHAR